jgi:hypothetical protein
MTVKSFLSQDTDLVLKLSSGIGRSSKFLLAIDSRVFFGSGILGPYHSSKLLLGLASRVLSFRAASGLMNIFRSKPSYMFGNGCLVLDERRVGLTEKLLHLLHCNSVRVYPHAHSVRVRAFVLWTPYTVCRSIITNNIYINYTENICQCRFLQQVVPQLIHPLRGGS